MVSRMCLTLGKWCVRSCAIIGRQSSNRWGKVSRLTSLINKHWAFGIEVWKHLTTFSWIHGCIEYSFCRRCVSMTLRILHEDCKCWMSHSKWHMAYVPTLRGPPRYQRVEPRHLHRGEHWKSAELRLRWNLTLSLIGHNPICRLPTGEEYNMTQKGQGAMLSHKIPGSQ